MPLREENYELPAGELYDVSFLHEYNHETIEGEVEDFDRVYNDQTEEILVE